MSEKYFQTTDKGGVVLDEYNGRYSLVQGREYNGNVYKNWCFPLFGQSASDKKSPIKIELGNSKEEAVANLLLILGELGYQAGNDKHEEDVPF